MLVISIQDLPRLWMFPDETLFVLGLGALNAVMSFSLFKSFEIGQLSIVSPIASSYPALSTILAIVVLNETLSQNRLAGLLVILAGIMLVSFRKRPELAHVKGRVASGVGYSLVAFASLGFLYFALKLVISDLGVLLPVLLIRSTAAVILTLMTGFAHEHPVHLDSRDLLLIGFIGLVASIGTIAYNLGLVSGTVAVVSTISGLFSAVTVLLALVVLKERLTIHQAIGFLSLLVGIVIIG